jgi:hypothetical protein
MRKNETFTITISKQPQVIGNTGNVKKDDVEHASDWVAMNYEALMQHYNNEITTDEFLKLIRKI